jgi:hypothetical protein
MRHRLRVKISVFCAPAPNLLFYQAENFKIVAEQKSAELRTTKCAENLVS